MSVRIFLQRITADEAGATAVEYGLILGLIVLAMFAALQNFAGAITQTWNTVNTSVSTAVAQANGG